MNRRQLLATAIAATVASAAASPVAGTPTDLPALFADDTAWLNSTPLTATDLTGHPVLVEFWTHGCSNCRNSLAWMKAIDAKYAARGLKVVAVHTPEFSSERDPAVIREALARLDIR